MPCWETGRMRLAQRLPSCSLSRLLLLLLLLVCAPARPATPKPELRQPVSPSPEGAMAVAADVAAMIPLDDAEEPPQAGCPARLPVDQVPRHDPVQGRD